MIVLACALAFVVAFVLDVADTEHKLAIERRERYAPGAWSVMMYLVGIGGTWAVLDVSHWLVVPTALGLFAGSVVAMRRQKSSE